MALNPIAVAFVICSPSWVDSGGGGGEAEGAGRGIDYESGKSDEVDKLEFENCKRKNERHQ